MLSENFSCLQTDKDDSNEMESKLNWSSGVNLILTFKSVIYMFVAIVLGYENKSYTYKLHLYCKSFQY